LVEPAFPALKDPQSTLSLLWLAALGVVFGDIGTSPLYALQTAIGLTGASHAIGVASLIIWTVILVVSVKYAYVLMKQDYKGQGGVFALFALLKASKEGKPPGFGIVAVVAFGAALLLGDGTLTPAISVLSAVEGIVTIHPKLAPLAPGASVIILIVLFALQRFGTGRLGSVYGPVMLLWFLVMAVMGGVQIIQHPSALVALNPLHGFGLLVSSGWHGTVIMGAVALAVTGAEALYADLANFGKGPILRAWYFVALPSLMLNYLGQAAYASAHPAEASGAGLFFLLCPMILRGPLVVLATLATVIASQALITAVFTLCRQAKALDLFPPFLTRHTNSRIREQIYMPAVNFLLGLACVLLVAFFQTGSSLANAYGVSVTGAMAVTSVLWLSVMVSRTGESRWQTFLVFGGMFALDLVLFLSCMTKFLAGGYIPVCFALVIMQLMFIWYRGRKFIGESMREGISPEQLGESLASSNLPRVPGTRVYLTREKTPEHSITSILEFQRRTKSVAENIVILMLPSTWSNPDQMIGEPTLKRHAGGLWEISVPHGYMVDADAPASLAAASRASGGPFTYDPEDTFYIFPREIPSPEGGRLPSWQRKIFSFVMRNVVLPDAFHIPSRQLVVYFAYVRA
jgi:KUP system potassium uptake protein